MRPSASGRSLLILAVLAVGCGHPASEAECQVIVERIVELELRTQHITDPVEIAKRKSESLGMRGSSVDILKGCVGKRITDRAFSCVLEAKSASEITERCLQ